MLNANENKNACNIANDDLELVRDKDAVDRGELS
jgi:hypothetical protein